MTSESEQTATDALKAANQRMHHAMEVEWTGDADVDFLLAMIPHHEGAIDMARVALKHSKDTEVLQLAQKIIVDQEKEITDMHRLLEQKHG